MAKHGAGSETASDLEAPAAAQAPEPSAAAVALALGEAGRDAGLTAKAAEFLDKQSRMLDLQMEHLHEQRALQIDHLKQQEKHLRLRFFGDRLRIGLQLLGIVAGLAVVLVVAAAAWSAHQDHGVVIEAFSVPPDLAARGQTGQVVASQLLDRLAGLQAKTVTGRPASSYANDWGGDIKVEIPETGVSIGELNRYLRQWLGAETRITGEVVRTPAGLALTARAGANPGATFQAADADLDSLIQRSAEAIYRQTQPYRYAVYLASQGRTDEAIAAYANLARNGDAEDQAWAYTGWGTLLLQRGDNREALAKATKALELDPRIDPAYPVKALAFGNLGRREGVFAEANAQLRLLESGRAKGISPKAASIMREYLKGAGLPIYLGDYQSGIATLSRLPETFDFEGAGAMYSFRGDLLTALYNSHDISAARRVLAGGPGPDPLTIAFALDDWSSALRLIELEVAKTPENAPTQAGRAYVLARLRRLAEAEAAVAATPLDCTQCLLVRGLIRGRDGDRQGADRWFAEAARRMDALPDAYYSWGQSLLEQGDLDGAIAKLREAHRRAPHHPDVLAQWGEALMRKGDYAGAAAKFAQADKGAPRWGRNHLRWGEALLRMGRYAEARAQFEAANGMDLGRPDRAALDVFLNRTAKGPLHG
jgi:tetratricopeptide (TPR) repeat protein